MDCETAAELSAGQALDAIEPEEAAALAEHLKGCPACRLQAEQDQRVVMRLPTTMKLVDPPPDLKRRLIARIEAMAARKAAGVGPGEAASGGAGGRRRFQALLSPHKRTLVLASLAGVAMFVAAWTVYQTVEVHDLKGENSQLAKDIQSQWAALTFATSPGVEAVHLTGTEMAPRAKGSLLVDYSENRVFIMATGLAPPSEGQVYRLWLWRPDGSLVTLGTFRTVRNGYAMWPVKSPVSLASHQAWALTLEAADVTTGPEGPMVLGSVAREPQR